MSHDQPSSRAAAGAADQPGSAGIAIENDALSARRDFLKRCGRYAAITPPIVTWLLCTVPPRYALAASGRQRDAADRDTEEAGDAPVRPAARVACVPSIQRIDGQPIQPIGAGNTIVRGPSSRNACRRSFF